MSQLVLASQSPRRRQILQEHGYDFLLRPPQLIESLAQGLSVDEKLKQLVKDKMQAFCQQYVAMLKDDVVVVTADTIVCLGEKIFTKPRDEEQAVQYLKSLSAKQHMVKTAIYLLKCPEYKWDCRVDTSQVFFRQLTEEEILNYVATGEPMDKAGAYAIQAGGEKFVHKIEGSRENIVGFPIRIFVAALEENNWHVCNR